MIILLLLTHLISQIYFLPDDINTLLTSRQLDLTFCGYVSDAIFISIVMGPFLHIWKMLLPQMLSNLKKHI